MDALQGRPRVEDIHSVAQLRALTLHARLTLTRGYAEGSSSANLAARIWLRSHGGRAPLLWGATDFQPFRPADVYHPSPDDYIAMANVILEWCDRKELAGAASLPPQTDPYFVFFRCWPGFTDAFPYDEINGLPDRDAELAARRALSAWMWQHRAEVSEREKVAYQEWLKGLKRQSKTVLGPSHAYNGPRQTVRQVWREMHGWGRLTSFVRLAVKAGWHNRHGLSDGSIFSPRVWLAEGGPLVIGLFDHADGSQRAMVVNRDLTQGASVRLTVGKGVTRPSLSYRLAAGSF